MRRYALIFGIILVVALPFSRAEETSTSQDPLEILRRSLPNWYRSLDVARDYTFQQRSVRTQFKNEDGDVLKTGSVTYQISIIYGETYAKLIARNDEPLSEKDQKKEDRKLDKFFEKQKNISEEERLRNRQKERDIFQREFADELLEALDWRVVGEEDIDGHPVWMFNATPKRDYRSNTRFGKLLSKVTGKLWITKADYHWVKAEADLIDNVTIGWFLLKLRKGAHLEFERTRVNDEVWLPKRASDESVGRVLGIPIRIRNTAEYRNYQKFMSDVKIIVTTDTIMATQEDPQQ